MLEQIAPQMHSTTTVLLAIIGNWKVQIRMARIGVKLKLLKPTGHVMHQQFNIQQLYALPTLYLCILYLSENKQWLVPLTP